MIFKGRQYRENRRIVPLPRSLWRQSNFIEFGRTVSITHPDPASVKGAIKTDYTWPNHPNLGDQTPAYAVPIPLHGHSLTNLAYGNDGRMYLLLDGKCYTAITPKEKQAREERRMRRLFT
jgi:hypothetical protein